MTDIRDTPRETREAMLQSYRHGFVTGARGRAMFEELGMPPPWSIDDYRRGWEAGTVTYQAAIEAEQCRLGLGRASCTVEALALRVLERAAAWWRAHRPVAWTPAEHLDNPTINAHNTEATRELAAAVGAYFAELGDPAVDRVVDDLGGLPLRRRGPML